MQFCLTNVLWFALVAGFATWIYLLSKRKHSYWRLKGIPGPEPIFLFGNFITRLFSDLNELNLEWARKYGPIVGFYQMFQPGLMITDPELIKQVTVKDFPHFVNRFIMPVYHDMWNQMLFFSEGEQWRRIRTIASPAFTSGKLRGMNSLMSKGVNKLEQHLDHLIATKDGVMETKKVISGFTIDVIASTTFALDTNANSDRTEDNLFVQNGKQILNFPIKRFIAINVLPRFVLNAIGFDHPFDPQSFDFFTKLTRHILSERRQLNISRNDLVQLLLDARVDEDALAKVNYDQLSATDDVAIEEEEKISAKISTKQKNQLTDSEMIANMIIFFTAGFETTASTISHCIFALAHNTTVQECLYKELSKALNKFDADNDDHSEEYSEAVLTKIPYLEAVIKETLRLYSPVNELNRLCQTEGYQLGKIKLSKNEAIFISTATIHLNPDYYPEPNRFNPDRFMPENKHLLVPYTYLPFGTGPRNCIGMRFAYQEIKLCIAKIVKHYRFSVTPNTPQKLTFKTGQPLRISMPFEVRVEKRL